MTKWHKLLTTVVDELIKTKGEVNNSNFWQNICHYSSSSRVCSLSGWITVFTVFNNDGEWQGDERTLYRCCNSTAIIIIIIIITRTASHTTKYIHQRDSPPVRLLGDECIISKSTQYVTVVTDITQ